MSCATAPERCWAQAVEAEIAALLGAHADKLTEDGRARLVRHGHLPEREIVSGIGPVAVRCSRVRDRVGKGVLRLLGRCPPIRRRCSYCRLGRLARLSARGIADTQARAWNRLRSAALVGPVGSHARSRRSDTGDHGGGCEARTHTKRDRRDLPSGDYCRDNVYARSAWSQRRLDHASGQRPVVDLLRELLPRDRSFA